MNENVKDKIKKCKYKKNDPSNLAFVDLVVWYCFKRMRFINSKVTFSIPEKKLQYYSHPL